MKSTKLCILLAAIFLSPLLPEVYGQIGNIRGTVTDNQGNPLEGVRIRIEGLESTRRYEVNTDAEGEYFHGGVTRQGAYRVIAEKDGFQSAYVEGIQAGSSRSDAGSEVDFALTPGQSGRLAFELTDEELKRAEQEAEEAQRAQKNAAQVKIHLDAGIALYDQGNYQGALAEFNSAAELDAKQPAVWANIGNSHSKLNNNEEALTAYETAIGISPEDPTLYQNLGGIYAAMGDTDKAREAYEHAIGLSRYGDPKDAAANYYNMGVTFINSGQNQEAIDALTKALEADPGYSEAHYQLGITLLGTGDMDGSLGHLQHYLELTPNGPNAEVARQLVDSLQQ